MNKQEFINSLKLKLSGLPKEEVDGRLEFYAEMIADRVDEGVTEERAVMDIGDIDDIATQILSEIPLRKIVKEKFRKKSTLSTREKVFLIVGFPIWLPLLISAAAVIFSLFVSLCAVVISLWAVDLSLAVCLIGGIGGFIISIFSGNIASGALVLAMGMVCAALSILLFFGCKETTKGCIWLGKKIVLTTKRAFIKKEEER